MKRIGIIGCGWLGSPLLQSLQSKGYHCFGTVRHVEMADESTIYYWDGQHPMSSSLQKQIVQCDALVVTIPPQKDLDKESNSSLHLAWAKELSQINDALLVLYTSSTSVYGDQTGDMYEKDHDTTARAYAIEKAYLRYFERAAIMRFGGLIGPGRNPAQFFSNGKIIPQPSGFVNMTHLDDAIGSIAQVLRLGSPGVFNVVSPQHITRRAFYCAAFQQQEKPMPTFDELDLSCGKKVISDKIIKHLGYTFKFESIADALSLTSNSRVN